MANYDFRKDFENGRHDYFVKEGKGEVKAISVSQLLQAQGIAEPLPLNDPVAMGFITRAGEAGTAKHKLLENYFKNNDLSALQDADCLYFIKSLKETFGSDIKMQNEKSYVLNAGGFYLAGTLDAVIEKDGKNYIVDFKTGTRRDTENWQLSFYAYLFEKNEGKKVDGLYILNSHNSKGERTQATDKIERLEDGDLEKVLSYQSKGEKIPFAELQEIKAKQRKPEIPERFAELDKELVKIEQKRNILEGKQDVKDYLQLEKEEKSITDEQKTFLDKISLSSWNSGYNKYSFTTRQTKSIDEEKLKGVISSLLEKIPEKEKVGLTPEGIISSCQNIKQSMSLRRTVIQDKREKGQER